MRALLYPLRALISSIRPWLVLTLLAGMLGAPRPAAAAVYLDDASAYPQHGAQDTSPPIAAADGRDAAAADATDLLAFTAGGHVLGFRADGVYIAGGDHVLRVEFAGASGIAPVAEGPSPDDGRARPLERVIYPGLWAGISLIYEPEDGGVAKSTYLVEPGARVEDIHLRYNTPVSLADDGGLTFAFETGQMREGAPLAWQEIEGERLPVAVAFRPLGDREVGFEVGPHDARHPLVIDPPLVWSTFLGGSGTDYGRAIAVDENGNVYVVGDTNATWGSPVRAFAGWYNTYVAKLNHDGALQWNTFLGGEFSTDYGYAIAVDSSGNVYVAGNSTASWQGDSSPVRTYYGSGTDAYVAKLDSSGGLTWNTFLGGSGTDRGYAIAVDSSGNVYVAGNSTASWQGDSSPVRAYYGSGTDAYVAKLDSSGGLTWNTFLGGSGSDEGDGIAVDASGNAHVAGISSESWGAPVRDHFDPGNTDAYVAKLDSSGGLTWNTFLGGSGSDVGYDIAVDASGNAHVAGYSAATWGSPVRAYYGSGSDAYVAKLDSSGALTWNTFLGGSGSDVGYGIAVDASGNAHVAGYSAATWGLPARAYTASNDAYVARLNGDGDLRWNTFLGGSGGDMDRGIALDGRGNAFVGGDSGATWGSPVLAYYGSGTDAFVARVSVADVFADPANSCGDFSPCYTTLADAIAALGVLSDTVSIYSGTYSESPSLSDVALVLAANATIAGDLTLGSGSILNTAGYTLTVGGNWSNTGGTYTSSGGRVIFDKAGTITLSKTGAGSSETFCNVTVTSGTTLSVSDDYIAIADGCSLTNDGIVKREAPAQNATSGVAVTYSDHLAYSTAVITSTGATDLGSTTVTATAGQTPPSCNGNAFSATPAKRWYDITPTATSNVAATVRLYYAPSEVNGTDASAMRIYHCGASGGWTQLSGLPTHGTDADGNYYVETSNVTDFSSFALSEGSPTAVTLASLTAQGFGSNVEVFWTTGSELDTLGFNLWRTEDDGGEWTQVNGLPIPASGSLPGASYSYQDITTSAGQRYGYWLEVLDLYGGSEWHGPITATAWWTYYLPSIRWN